MASNQSNVADNPDDVMRRFLPELKRALNIDDLILFLLSEDAICDDDPPKLTVSGQLSKAQALVNLQQIIATRGTIKQFLRALERSSELHAGHKELYDKMAGERQRRISISSRRSSTSRLTRNSITSQTQLVPEINQAQVDSTLSEIPPPTAIVAQLQSVGPSVSVTQSTGASPSGIMGQEVTSPAPEQNVHRDSQPQRTVNVVATDVYQQQPEIKSFWIGWLFGGFCVIALTLAALAIATIVYGALGIQGKDKCGFSDTRVGAFDASSGGLLLILIILTVVLMILYTAHKVYLEDCSFLITLIFVVLAIVVVVGVIANVLFSFVSVVKVVYRDYEMWNPDNIDCSSPSFFSAFTYVTAEFVLIALVIFILCGLCWWHCRPQQ